MSSSLNCCNAADFVCDSACDRNNYGSEGDYESVSTSLLLSKCVLSNARSLRNKLTDLHFLIIIIIIIINIFVKRHRQSYSLLENDQPSLVLITESCLNTVTDMTELEVVCYHLYQSIFILIK